eukprot:g7500.t1
MDGGGLRLYYTNQILKKIEDQIQNYCVDHPAEFPEGQQFSSKEKFVVYLADYFDCIAGTSAASWVAVYLASKGGKGKANDVFTDRKVIEKYGQIIPGTAKGMDVFFQEYGASIYPSGALNYFRGISINWRSWFPIRIPLVNAPLHPVRGLETALDAFVGDLAFTDVYTSCLVNAYDLKSSGPIGFIADHLSEPPRVTLAYLRAQNDPTRYLRNATGSVSRNEQLTDDNLAVRPGVVFKLKDAALGSSAMPMYHPAHTAKPVNGSNEEFTFVDGVLVDSNPTLFAFNFVTSREGVSVADVAIVSLGSGGAAANYMGNVDRGFIAWLLSRDMIEIVTDGASETKQAEVEYLFYKTFNMKAGQYLRINYFAETPGSDESEAFSTFDSPDYLSTYKNIGESTANKYSYGIAFFVENYIFASKTMKHGDVSK